MPARFKKTLQGETGTGIPQMGDLPRPLVGEGPRLRRILSRAHGGTRREARYNPVGRFIRERTGRRGLGIGWREVLGLLIGVGVCYGVISYAALLTSQSQDRGTAPELTREDTRSGGIEPRTDPAASYGDASEGETVTVRVTGAEGVPFGAIYGNLRASRSVEGVVPAEYEVRVQTDPGSADYAWAEAWKTAGDSKELRVQILDDGDKAIRQFSTTEDYGSAYVRWNPNEKAPPSGETTAASEGTRLRPRP